MSDDLWTSLGGWWVEELKSDPAYKEEIEPWLVELLNPVQEKLYLDVGCGEGRLLQSLKALGCTMVGCDLNSQLLRRASARGLVVRARLPELGWVRSGSFDGAAVSLVLDHLADESAFFKGLAAAVKPGGGLALVINHPIWTAPNSSPIEDSSGEMLWRPGTYFRRGYSDEPAGKQTVRFYHRTSAELLNAASAAGWDLERLEERGVSPAQVVSHPEYAGQEHIPRLLGAKWRRRT